jgi:hypothetical protein
MVRVDLRSVMAEAAATKPRTVTVPVVGTASPARRPGLPPTTSTPAKSPSLARSPPSAGGSSSAPWRAVERAKSSFTSVQAQQSPPVRPVLPQGTPSRSSNVITPVKLQPAPGGQRKNSCVSFVPRVGAQTDVQWCSMDSYDIFRAPSPRSLHIARFSVFLSISHPTGRARLRENVKEASNAELCRDSGGREREGEEQDGRGRVHAMVGGRKGEGRW